MPGRTISERKVEIILLRKSSSQLPSRIVFRHSPFALVSPAPKCSHFKTKLENKQPHNYVKYIQFFSAIPQLPHFSTPLNIHFFDDYFSHSSRYLNCFKLPRFVILITDSNEKRKRRRQGKIVRQQKGDRKKKGILKRGKYKFRIKKALLKVSLLIFHLCIGIIFSRFSPIK